MAPTIIAEMIDGMIGHLVMTGIEMIVGTTDVTIDTAMTDPLAVTAPG